MKPNIVRASIKDVGGFLIEIEEGYMKYQRCGMYSTVESALSSNEEIICALCERILELEGSIEP